MKKKDEILSTKKLIINECEPKKIPEKIKINEDGIGTSKKMLERKIKINTDNG